MALDITDKTSNGNNLTNNGGVTEVTSSLPFTASTSAAGIAKASSQYLSIADASQTGLDLTTTGTLEGWFKFASLPSSGYYYLISKDDGTTYPYWFRLISPGNTLQAGVSSDGVHFDIYNWSFTPTLNTWYHLAVTINTGNASATTFELFVNGSSQGNGSAIQTDNIATIYNTTAPFAVGARAAGTPTYFFDGVVDDIRVWNDIRTSTEISNNYQLELTGAEENLVAYYPFESLTTFIPKVIII